MRKAIVIAALIALSAFGMVRALAHSGDVTVSQDCTTFDAVVTLNHDVTLDRDVDVITTIPGTTGFTGAHFDTSYGVIWSVSGPGPTTGTVTLNIYNNGRLEFTDSDMLQGVGPCSTPTPTPTETPSPTPTVPSPTPTPTETSPPPTPTPPPTHTPPPNDEERCRLPGPPRCPPIVHPPTGTTFTG